MATTRKEQVERDLECVREEIRKATQAASLSMDGHSLSRQSLDALQKREGQLEWDLAELLTGGPFTRTTFARPHGFVGSYPYWQGQRYAPEESEASGSGGGGAPPAPVATPYFAAIGATAAAALAALDTDGPARTESDSSVITIANSDVASFIAFAVINTKAALTDIRQQGSISGARATFNLSPGQHPITYNGLTGTYRIYISQFPWNALLLGGPWSLT